MAIREETMKNKSSQDIARIRRGCCEPNVTRVTKHNPVCIQPPNKIGVNHDCQPNQTPLLVFNFFS